MTKELHIYHGSGEIVKEPLYGIGRKHNDYGQGFYCTESEDLAREWACSSEKDGFANHYILDTSLLNVLDLDTGEYTILNWIAVLIDNRVFSVDSPVTGRAMRYLKENFYVNVNAYDVIIGYRADDAYFNFANAFLNNMISVEQLARAMMLGKLDEQVVLKSKLAFDNIRFQGFTIADNSEYYPKRKDRVRQAEQEYRDICEEESDGLYMLDILRKKITNDDERLPRAGRVTRAE